MILNPTECEYIRHPQYIVGIFTIYFFKWKVKMNIESWILRSALAIESKQILLGLMYEACNIL